MLMADTVILADPAVVPAMRETDTVPVSSGVMTVYVCVALLKVPREVVKVTEVPLGTAAPLLYFMVAVMILELAPSAGMLVGSVFRVMEPLPMLSKDMPVVVVMVP